MNRRHFTFGALLGLFGIKAIAQDQVPIATGTTTSSGTVPLKWPKCKSAQAGIGFFDSKEGYICVNDADPAKGEEYCPIGHANKPRINVAPSAISEAIRSCSVCGVVYVPMKEKK